MEIKIPLVVVVEAIFLKVLLNIFTPDCAVFEIPYVAVPNPPISPVGVPAYEAPIVELDISHDRSGKAAVPSRLIPP